VVDGLQAASEETAIPLRYLGLSALYAALITAAALALAISLFQRREVG